MINVIRMLRLAVIPGLVFGYAVVTHAQEVDLSKVSDYPHQPVTEATWSETSDNMRWMARHFSVKPSLILSRGDELLTIPVQALANERLENLSFEIPGQESPLPLSQALAQASVDAYLVLKDGKLLY